MARNLGNRLSKLEKAFESTPQIRAAKRRKVATILSALDRIIAFAHQAEKARDELKKLQRNK